MKFGSTKLVMPAPVLAEVVLRPATAGVTSGVPVSALMPVRVAPGAVQLFTAAAGVPFAESEQFTEPISRPVLV